jgi:dipeptidase D
MSNNAVADLDPKILWQRFYEISQVPRPSKKEEKIRTFLKNLLKELKIEFNEDKVGNIIAKVPATKGFENAPTVVLQGHVDMVCEKNKEKKFDFDNDPIQLKKVDGWITADGTTLGSDNGIGVAAALAVVTDPEVTHPPLELLFTVDEETGLTGANNLEKGTLEGKTLLNMDSEEDGAFYVGCSGGVDTLGHFKIDYEKSPSGFKTYELMVTGLKGGHSGLDIKTGRANGIKQLGRILNSIKSFNLKIASIDGGSLRNAIPREAEAVLLIDNKQAAEVEKTVREMEKKILNEFKTPDGGFKVIFKAVDKKPSDVFTNEFSEKLINAILALPHGIIAMSPDIEGLVETSTNLATVKISGEKLVIGTSQRSSVDSAKEYIASSVASIFRLAGAEVEIGDGYPGWKPNLDSELLKISKDVFKKMFNKDPEIKAIHAGLECGILESKNPGMDMISFGPTIMGAHSPDEKINIETVKRFYDLLKGILKRLSERN